MTPTEFRTDLLHAGFDPLPLEGKAPSMMQGWQTKIGVGEPEIMLWGKLYPHANNSGILTRRVPTLDIDVTHEPAAQAIEELTRERYEEAGPILVRFGMRPKFCIPFRTDEPFDKIVVNLSGPDGSKHKIEFLANGQQVVVAGVHPDTHKPYTWHGGELGKIKREDLPYIREAEAQQLVDDAIQLLIEQFGFKLVGGTRKGKAAGDGANGADADWARLAENIRTGVSLHDSLRDLAAKLVASGMAGGAAVNYLRSLMDAASCEHDTRWKARRREIPHLVTSAEEKFARKDDMDPVAAPPAGVIPSTIEETLAVFDKWLIFKSRTPVYAMLGAVAANLLEGSPMWLGLVGPPSSAKTELLNSISLLPNVVQAATLTAAALLSGTPKNQRAAGAKGGLLRQINTFGIIALKDFTSILAMHPETRAELLAALREIFDGHWTRHLGTDGGRTLAWNGKVGLLFGVTPVIDTFHSVNSAMGDRFLLARLAPIARRQITYSLKHRRAATAVMRKELAEAVVRLFAARRLEPRPITDDEIERLTPIILRVVRLRGAIERDRRTRELEMVLGAEGPARLTLALEQLLAGLDTLGIDRGTALQTSSDCSWASASAQAWGSTTAMMTNCIFPWRALRRASR
jgi:hypothetical protein